MIRKHCQCFGKIDKLKKIINTAQNADYCEEGEDTLKMGTRRRARTAVRPITIIILILSFIRCICLLLCACLINNVYLCLVLSNIAKH